MSRRRVKSLADSLTDRLAVWVDILVYHHELWQFLSQYAQSWPDMQNWWTARPSSDWWRLETDEYGSSPSLVFFIFSVISFTGHLLCYLSHSNHFVLFCSTFVPWSSWTVSLPHSHVGFMPWLRETCTERTPLPLSKAKTSTHWRGGEDKGRQSEGACVGGSEKDRARKK